MSTSIFNVFDVEVQYNFRGPFLKIHLFAGGGIRKTINHSYGLYALGNKVLQATRYRLGKFLLMIYWYTIVCYIGLCRFEEEKENVQLSYKMFLRNFIFRKIISYVFPKKSVFLDKVHKLCIILLGACLAKNSNQYSPWLGQGRRKKLLSFNYMSIRVPGQWSHILNIFFSGNLQLLL